MSIAHSALGEEAVAAVTRQTSPKVPPKRLTTAVPDRTATPEPR